MKKVIRKIKYGIFKLFYELIALLNVSVKLNFLDIENDKIYILDYPHLGNLGDEIQSIAMKDVLANMGLGVDYIERESLACNFLSFKRKIVMMNGWFAHDRGALPVSYTIIPVFIGFHLSRLDWLENKFIKNQLNKFGPIGCRDSSTLNALKRKKIKSYLSYCPTLTLKRRDSEKILDKCLVVDAHLNNPDGHTSDARALLDLVVSRYKITDYDTSSQNCDPNTSVNEKRVLAEAQLKLFCSYRLVITSRLHVALPCLAMDVPVIFIHRNADQEPRIECYLSYMWHLTEASTVLPSTPNWRSILNPIGVCSISSEIESNIKRSLANIIALG